MNNVPGSGARWLDVSADRFAGWVSGFAGRHGDGPLGVELAGKAVTFTAPDGAVAQCHPPFAESFAPARGLADPDELAARVVAHAQVPRAVGVLLVRLGGYAAGVFAGYPPALADAKVGSRLVHGRSAAGGWSQHRFARRREKQANEALEAAASTAAAVFGRWTSGITATGAAAQASRAPAQASRQSPRAGRPSESGPAAGAMASGGVSRNRSASRESSAGAAAAPGRVPRLDAVVLGGDKRAVAELRDDPRLAPYLVLATERFLTVPDPKRAVLEGTPRLFLAVRIRLTEPSG